MRRISWLLPAAASAALLGFAAPVAVDGRGFSYEIVFDATSAA
jgi:hypothetical protein